MKKPWWKSKTIWIDVLTLLGVIITSITAWPDMQQYGTQLATALAVVNVMLRMITNEGLSYGDKEK